MAKFGLKALSIIDDGFTAVGAENAAASLDSLFWRVSSGRATTSRMADEAITKLKEHANQGPGNSLPVTSAEATLAMLVQAEFALDSQRVEFLQLVLKKLRKNLWFHEETLVKGIVGHFERIEPTDRLVRLERLWKLWVAEIIDIRTVVLEIMGWMGKDSFLADLLKLLDQEKRNGGATGNNPLTTTSPTFFSELVFYFVHLGLPALRDDASKGPQGNDEVVLQESLFAQGSPVERKEVLGLLKLITSRAREVFQSDAPPRKSLELEAWVIVLQNLRSSEMLSGTLVRSYQDLQFLEGFVPAQLCRSPDACVKALSEVYQCSGGDKMSYDYVALSPAHELLYKELALSFTAARLEVLLRKYLPENRLAWRQLLSFLSVVLDTRVELGQVLAKIVEEQLDRAFQTTESYHLFLAFALLRLLARERPSSYDYRDWFTRQFFNLKEGRLTSKKATDFFVRCLTQMLPVEHSSYLGIHLTMISLMMQEKVNYASYQQHAKSHLTKLGISLEDVMQSVKKKSGAESAASAADSAATNQKMISHLNGALAEFSKTGKISEQWNSERIFNINFYKKELLPALLGVREFSNPHTALLLSDPELEAQRARFIEVLHQYFPIQADLWKEYQSSLRSGRKPDASTSVLLLSLGEVPTDEALPDVSDDRLISDLCAILADLPSVSSMHKKAGGKLPADQMTNYFSGLRGSLYQLDKQVKKKLAFWDTSLSSNVLRKMSKIVLPPCSPISKASSSLFTLEEDLGTLLLENFFRLGEVNVSNSRESAGSSLVPLSHGIVWHMNFILAVAGTWSLHRGFFFSLWKVITELPWDSAGEEDLRRFDMVGLLMALICTRESQFEKVHRGAEILPFLASLFTIPLEAQILDSELLLRLVRVGVSFHNITEALRHEIPGFFTSPDASLPKSVTHEGLAHPVSDLPPSSPLPGVALRVFSIVLNRVAFIDPRCPSPLQLGWLACAKEVQAHADFCAIVSVNIPKTVAAWINVEFSLLLSPNDFLSSATRHESMRTTLTTWFFSRTHSAAAAHLLKGVFLASCSSAAGKIGKGGQHLKEDAIFHCCAMLLHEVSSYLREKGDSKPAGWLKELLTSPTSASQASEIVNLLVSLPSEFLYHAGLGFDLFPGSTSRGGSDGTSPLPSLILDSLEPLHALLKGTLSPEAGALPLELSSWLLQGVLSCAQVCGKSDSSATEGNCLTLALISQAPLVMTSFVVHFPHLRGMLSRYAPRPCCGMHKRSLQDAIQGLFEYSAGFVSQGLAPAPVSPLCEMKSPMVLKFEAAVLVEVFLTQAASRSAQDCAEVSAAFQAATLALTNRDLKREIFSASLEKLVSFFATAAEVDGSLDAESLAMFFKPPSLSRQDPLKVFHALKEAIVMLLDEDAVGFCPCFPDGHKLLYDEKRKTALYGLDQLTETDLRTLLLRQLLVFCLLLGVRGSALHDLSRQSQGGSLYCGYLISAYASLYRAMCPFPATGPGTDAPQEIAPQTTVSLKVMRAIELFVTSAVKSHDASVLLVADSVVGVFGTSAFGNLLGTKKRKSAKLGGPAEVEPPPKKVKTQLPTTEDLMNVFKKCK